MIPGTEKSKTTNKNKSRHGVFCSVPAAANEEIEKTVSRIKDLPAFPGDPFCQVSHFSLPD